jgi:hypothetical protein
MLKQYFSLKIEDGDLLLQGTNFLISKPIDQALIITDVIRNLRALNLRTDTKALNYVIREKEFFAEGWAYEDNPFPLSELIIM